MAKKTARKKKGAGKDERFELRMSPAEKKAFVAAANAQGLSLGHWLRLAGRMVVSKNDGKVELVELE
jgi:predicted HicB family RNase H-like nuclease